MSAESDERRRNKGRELVDNAVWIFPSRTTCFLGYALLGEQLLIPFFYLLGTSKSHGAILLFLGLLRDPFHAVDLIHSAKLSSPKSLRLWQGANRSNGQIMKR